MPERIFVMDRASGALQARLGPLPSSVVHLAFSVDGRWLAAALGGHSGVRLFDAKTGKLLAEDASYGESAYSVDFPPQAPAVDGARAAGRLLTTSFDGKLRLYTIAADGTLGVRCEDAALRGKKPFAARFSPDGRRIAVGFADTTAVQVLDASTLAEVAQVPTTGVDDGNLSSLAWSADGESLLAAGRWQKNGKKMARRWSTNGLWPSTDSEVAGNTIRDLVSLPAAAGGGWLFASADPSWGVLGPTGERLRRVEPVTADFRGQLSALRVSPDGRRVGFGYLPGGKEPRVLDVAQPALLGAADGLLAARTEAPGLDIQDWKNGEAPRVGDRTLTTRPDDTSRSLAISPAGRRFVLGSDFALRLYGRDGSHLGDASTPGTAWAVNIARDAPFVIAAYDDGTIRWHRLDTLEEVLAFFPHADRTRWIMWTPEGFFASSSREAESLIGYHLDRGPEREGDFVEASQLRERFYQPDLIAHRLDADGDARLRDALEGARGAGEALARAPAPEITRLSLAEATVEDTYVMKLRVKRTGEGSGRIVVRVNGRELPARPVMPRFTAGANLEVPVPLRESGTYDVEAMLVDARGIASAAAKARVTVPPQAEERAPRLHVLAIGVTRYRDHALREGVKFAAADAAAVAGALAAAPADLYKPGVVKLLQDDDASAQKIQATAREMGREIAPEDLAIVYLAGHGLTIEGQYNFIPWEALTLNLGAVQRASLDDRKLRDVIAELKAKKILVLIDTCSSGGFILENGRGPAADKFALERLGKLSGVSIFAAVAEGKMALEGEKGHGVFTFALLRALGGAADKDGDRRVEVEEIARYLQEQVPAISERNWQTTQVPMIRITGGMFPVVSLPRP